LGTDNKELLEDPHYLGYRKPRLVGEQYDLFLERFARAVHAVFPKALVQWEDFSKQNAFTIVERYRDYLISFNDDIQGTGAVVLSAILAACKKSKRRVGDSVYVISGAGAGGMGVAKQIYRAMRLEGLNRFECYSRIWLTDSHGLLFHGRAGDAIEPYKRIFAHSKADVVGIWGDVESVSLLDVVRGSRCDVLIGLSGQPGQFTEEVVEAMLENSDTPLVMPCSNPTVNSEILPEDLYRLTHNKALCVSGSPFPDVTVDGVLRRTGQANNAFIFPGVGLGTLVSGARKVTEQMFTAASYALAELVPLPDIEQGYLMPCQSRLRECSVQVAMAVAEQAIKDGVAMPGFEVSREAIEKAMWSPVYETYEAQQSQPGQRSLSSGPSGN
jgi:malate dehydrogenase (oxaloacetate-decarboxylating)